jgi:hypothetical protein
MNLHLNNSTFTKQYLMYCFIIFNSNFILLLIVIMKKNALFLLFLCTIHLNLFAQNISIPDANFKTALVALGIDTNGDSEISQSEAEATTSLNIPYKPISDLTGIQSFINLTFLDCGSNNLTVLDISKNTKLTYLGCYYNSLSSLDISNNLLLKTLACGKNPIQSLDITKHISLTNLSCYSNQLSSLDVSKNTALTSLSCSQNKLTQLDVSTNIALTDLDIYDNLLTVLDVSKNTLLKSILCFTNSLTTIDLSTNTVLTHLECNDNKLNILDLTQTAVTYLKCENNTNIQRMCVTEAQLEMSVNSPTSFVKDPNVVLSLTCASFTSSITGPKTIATRQKNVVYSVPLRTGYTYDWEIGGGGTITSGQNTNKIIVDWGVQLPITTTCNVIVTEQTPDNSLRQSTTAYITILSNPQIIYIPDANFKNALLNNSIDINHDSEIAINEAQLLSVLYVPHMSISDLTGIEYFVNLNQLDCQGNDLSSLDLSTLYLTRLNCTANSNLLQICLSDDELNTATAAAVNDPTSWSKDPFATWSTACGLTNTIVGQLSPTLNQQNVLYSIVPLAGSTYQWTVTGGTIASGQNTDSIFVNWDGGSSANLRTTAIGYSVSVVETSASNVSKTVTTEITMLGTTTAIKQPFQTASILVYPNPSAETFTIVMPINVVSVAYQIFDLSGKVLQSGSFISSDTGNKIGQDLPTGMFQVVLNDGQNQTSKLISKIQ